MSTEDIHHAIKEVRALLAKVDGLAKEISPSAGKMLRKELEFVADDLRERLTNLDPVRMPSAFFDPSNPSLFSTFAAVALIGQDKAPLRKVAEGKFYGSGIYAIYYAGSSQIYSAISGTETPIYVGKAEPRGDHARSPKEQGTTLSSRLDEHRKNIQRAENLSIDDFECRHLVVASGWQAAAEKALIGLFHPLWNKETKILQGFGKHGDSSSTRRNTRSSWDVLHPGREWARTNHVEDATTPAAIQAAVWAHFARHPPIQDVQQVLHDLLARIRTD